MIVKIIPINKRMKDRVAQHGSIMRVARKNTVIDGVRYDLELESINNTFKSAPGLMTKWSGWVVIGKDCNIEILTQECHK